jgi:S-methylmethionine-dependent homocysteine/selenocysteine methylase
MSYRKRLPQLGASVFLTGGDIERCLTLQGAVDLPVLAAFELLKHSSGRSALSKYFERYAELAHSHAMGLVLDAPTARANADWGAILGYDTNQLATARAAALDLLLQVRSRWETPDTPIVVSGSVGPRTDGYNPALRMSTYEAAHYHAPAIEFFARNAADQACAFGMSYVEEASGIALVAAAHGLPLAISLKPGPSGRLLSGDTVSDAIARIDRETLLAPAYYLVECTRASQLAEILSNSTEASRKRIRGVRFNTSASPDADTVSAQYRMASAVLPNITLIGTQLEQTDAPGPASTVYSSEFVIAAARGRSGPALLRTPRTVQQEGAALFS